MRRNTLKRREAQAVDVDPTENSEGSENLGHKHAFDDMTDHENPDCACSGFLSEQFQLSELDLFLTVRYVY